MLEHIISLSESAAAAAPSETPRTVLENLGLGGSVALLGLAIVFMGLVSLIVITIVYPKIVRALLSKSAKGKEKSAAKKLAKTKTEVKTPVAAQKTAAPAAANPKNDDELIAVITAAIAASLGTSSNGVVIKSIERTGQNVPAWGARGRIEQVYNRF